MMHITLINSVVTWERRLELQEDRPHIHPSVPVVNYLAAPQAGQNESSHPYAGRPPVDFIKALSWVFALAK